MLKSVNFEEIEKRAIGAEDQVDMYTLFSEEFWVPRHQIKALLFGYLYRTDTHRVGINVVEECRQALLNLGLKPVPTGKALTIMKHAWGFDSKEAGYRNRYCTYLDDPDMVSLVFDEWMKGPTGVGSVGHNCGIYFLTDKGIELLKELRGRNSKKT